ncbi:amidohydrolase family protein [Mucilaginibacter ginkgonis]|uniref:Amidohydrolase family protein n=1 Tax=Mucilaginibacter ginkgonis TaxID=2682091 RepID=A0A6I4INL2_9SPHI|nr:amidohydrolase family protein [Mucilaginibacter ginkgonis]QQL48796.1 amidohydrolase family protein [Mucilaginibacter ginkgonis]
MKSYRADYVFTITADPIKNGVVTVDDNGTIISVGTEPPDSNTQVQQLSGVITPGFINTHSHIELAHLKDKIEKDCGLVRFIKLVQKQREVDRSEAIDAAYRADAEMYENGIVAVGDISNTDISVDVKLNSKLYYHTFIELFSFLPQRAEEVFNKGLELKKEFKNSNTSVTPHAPYSVSKDLFRLIKDYCSKHDNLITMHNQECEDENRFYRYKSGEFLDLYESFGLDISYFKPQARNSLQTVVPLLTSKQKILLVHNTYTNLKDIYFIKRFDKRISWCFCPGANMYIESRLPKIELFLDQKANITLGTDSLASNTKLSILYEMSLIQSAFPSVTLQSLLQWATLNGASYLGIDEEKGSIAPGKTPGLNLLTGLDGFTITPETKVQRIV